MNLSSDELKTIDRVKLYSYLVEQFSKSHAPNDKNESCFNGLCQYFENLYKSEHFPISGGQYNRLMIDLRAYARANNLDMYRGGWFWNAYEIAPRLNYLKSCLAYYQGELLKELPK